MRECRKVGVHEEIVQVERGLFTMSVSRRQLLFFHRLGICFIDVTSWLYFGSGLVLGALSLGAGRPDFVSLSHREACRPDLVSLTLWARFGLSSMLDANVDTLKNMNPHSSKFGKWIVRILSPKVIPYTFKTQRGEVVNAKRFNCILVSKDPSQYMLGVVNFSFQQRDAAEKACERFKEGRVFEIIQPSFDAKAKTDFNGCPVKLQVLLCKPTVIKEVPEARTDLWSYPARGIRIPGDFTTLIRVLKESTSRNSSNQVFDFAGKFLGASAPKDIPKEDGKTRKVSEASFVDMTGGTIVVHVWDQAYESVISQLKEGQGCSVFGVNVRKQEGEVKLHMWDCAWVSTVGPYAEAFTSLDHTVLETNSLTPQFSPGVRSLEDAITASMGEFGLPTCSAALAQADVERLVTFQINRCVLYPPTTPDLLQTQKGDLFIKNCRLRDRTGSVDVDILSGAIPFLFGCKTEHELRGLFSSPMLTSTKQRLNVRGVMRKEGDVMRRYVIKVEPTDLLAKVSLSVMRIAQGLCDVDGDAVLAVPANRILDYPVIGLAAKRDIGPPLGAHAILLLVKGTEKTTVDALNKPERVEDGKFKLTSQGVRCLLSNPPVSLTLEGYTDFAGMLDYRLDTEPALVLASACLLYTSPSPRDATLSRMPSSA